MSFIDSKIDITLHLSPYTLNPDFWTESPKIRILGGGGLVLGGGGQGSLFFGELRFHSKS